MKRNRLVVILGIIALLGFALAGCESLPEMSAAPVATNGLVVIVNNSSDEINQLFYAPSSSSAWGPDRLNGTIPVGGSYTITDLPADMYDFKVMVGMQGARAELQDYTLASGTTKEWVVTDATLE